MHLIPIETTDDFLLAERFLLPHEETCVSLASLVRRRTDKLVLLVKSENTVVEPVEITAVLGIINLDSTIYHCIPNPEQLDADFLKAELPYLMKKPVRCISGETGSTKFLIEIFEQGGFAPSTRLRDRKLNHPEIVYDYKMMKFSVPSAATENVAISLSGGEEIIRCTENDIEILHPLQKDYMKEEVAVPGRAITDTEVSLTLRQILKNQLCFALTVDGDIVAKANTNAIGINCIQIGGVYTHPLYRRNGYAGALVQALCNRASRAQKQPVLFVKEKNKPAFSLYQKLGFEECGHYTIAYY